MKLPVGLLTSEANAPACSFGGLSVEEVQDCFVQATF